MGCWAGSYGGHWAGSFRLTWSNFSMDLAQRSTTSCSVRVRPLQVSSAGNPEFYNFVTSASVENWNGAGVIRIEKKKGFQRCMAVWTGAHASLMGPTVISIKDGNRFQLH